METSSLTPVRPARAERARTVLAAAASVSVSWDAGRVDLLGCHHDDPRGDVILTLEPGSALVRAARAEPNGALPVDIQLTDLSPVSTRERIRARMLLRGTIAMGPAAAAQPGRHAASLHVGISEIYLTEFGGPDPGCAPVQIELAQYRRAEPDPLHLGAAEQLQHLMAHHPEAIGLLARLCEPAVLLGATRVLPISLDRFGLVLRVERLRGHVDVRLTFGCSVETADEAAGAIRGLMLAAHRRRPCLRPHRP